MPEFEWDEAKAESNFTKHNVSFREATSVLYDPLAITHHDSFHSEDEPRFIELGMSNRNRLLVIAYTERNDRIRIISARLATKREQKQYEQ